MDEKNHGKSEQIQASWQGDVFAVGYILDIYVKHKVWSGVGDKVGMPIRVLAPLPKTTVSSEPPRLPKEWAPITDEFEPTYLYHDQQKVSKYFSDVFSANWLAWYKRINLDAPADITPEFYLSGQSVTANVVPE